MPSSLRALGSSFTGDLSVDPRHRRELMAAPTEVHVAVHTNADGEGAGDGTEPVVVRLPELAIERRLRKRDAVEAALSDVILLGTEEQVRLAAAAARDMVAGRPVLLAPLVHAGQTMARRYYDETCEEMLRMGLRAPAGGLGSWWASRGSRCP